MITGLRRSGKSTLLQQIRSDSKEKNYYFNFDDDRLIHFTLVDFELLLELFIELYGLEETFYFDEIQNIVGWERFVRRLHDQNYKIYITGSNAAIFSQELGTRLTGRLYKD
ncbi:MAG: AAA family ATPase [Coxiellaceae bacterium]|nr:AAA family ATPase [Coxiellaceae bacterium]